MDIKRRILAGFIVLGVSQAFVIPISLALLVFKGAFPPIIYFTLESSVMFAYGFSLGEVI